MKKIFQQFFSLFSGTAVSQLIPIIITPLLTRLYTPFDFGVYASYISLVTILFVICTGRYELAILSTKSKAEAITLGYSTIFLSFLFNIILLLFIIIFGDKILNIIGYQDLSIFIYGLPFSLLLMSIFQTCYFLLNRFEFYSLMSRAIILQSFSIAISNYMLGVISFNVGLVVGYIIGQFISAIHILYISNNKGLIPNNDLMFNEIKECWKEFISFPKYLIVSNLANRISLQSTVIIFTKYFDSHQLGNYSLTHRLLKIPMSFFGNSVSQLYRQKMSVAIQNRNNVVQLYFITFVILLSVGLPIFVFIYLFSEKIFVILLGKQWIEAGIYAKILVPMLYAQFCIAPLSSIFLFDNKQKYDLFWQLLSLIIVFPTLIITSVTTGDIKLSLRYYSYSYVILYLINMLMSYYVTRKIGESLEK